MKFIDLFAGIGGFRQGFESAGHECVFSSEINEHCQAVYNNNFNEVPASDITLINEKEIPNFDILLAGFPCQPFSISGYKKGFEDTRGTLFFDICRILEEKKPPIAVLENVKHLIHHDNGNTLKIIIKTLEELGYYVEWKLLNAKNFGLPQNRERIILIATLLKPFDFSLIEEVETPMLEHFLDKEGSFEYLDKSEYTLIDNPIKQKSGLIFAGYRNKNIWKKGVRPNTLHLSRVHRQPNRIYSVKGSHPTIPSQETSGRFFIYLPEEDKVRKLTLNECYKIMGFDDSFKRSEKIGEQYKQIGNSVAIPMIKEIAKQLKNQGFINDRQRKTIRPIQSLFEFQECSAS